MIPFWLYLSWTQARLCVIVLHAVFDTSTALLNHFPLFALLLRVKDPLRLPGLLLRLPFRARFKQLMALI